MTLVERARLLLAKHPPAIEGQGGNSTTFSAAAALVWGFGLEPEEALPLLLEYNDRCEPPWRQSDLRRMCHSVMKTGGRGKARGYLVTEDVEKGSIPLIAPEQPKTLRKRDHDLAKLKEMQAKGLPTDMGGWRLWLRSRSPVDPRAVTPVEYLDALYRPGERVLIFEKLWGTQGDYGRVVGERTMKLGRLPTDRHVRIDDLPPGSAEGMVFLMQPVDGRWHPVAKPDGRVEMSRRTKASVTRWPYMLLESDKVPLELWLNVMVRAKIRICSITQSGGRSLHALVRLDKETEDELQSELQDAGSRELLSILGCDHQAMNSLVYPRLPNTLRHGKRMAKRDRQTNEVIRKNGRAVMEFVAFRDGPAKQSLIYWNPEPELNRSIVEGAIFEHEGR